MSNETMRCWPEECRSGRCRFRPVASWDPGQGLPEDADVTQLDLDTYRDAALAQSIAALALRGLIEEFQPKVAAPPQE